MLTLLLATPGILLADDGVASAGESPILELVTIASYVLAPISILVLWRTRFWRALNVDGVVLPTPWRLSAPAGVGLFVGSFLFGGIGASLAKAALSPDVDPLLGGALLNWGSVLGMAVAGVAAAILWKGAPRVEGGGPLVDLRSSMIMALIAAILVIPLVQASSSLGQFLQILLSGTTPSPLGHETLRLMASSTDNAVAWWLVAGAVVLGAPVVEEIIYRGFLQQSARKVGVGPIWASIMIGGFFALMHLPALPVDSRMAGLSGLLVFGTGLGLLRERTGRLDACILVHAVFNAFNLILATAIG